MNRDVHYGQSTLPAGIRSRRYPRINGLDMHVLEAGSDAADVPVVLLLHGFPELAYSWRKVMLPLAAAGYRVLAPDQRGYGRTEGWACTYDDDIRPFNVLNVTLDALALLKALGIGRVALVVGHDFGASVAAYAGLVRPDVFGSVVLMSAPFSGPPDLPKPSSGAMPLRRISSVDAITPDLLALDPPRKHYHAYYATRAANSDMTNPPQGLHAFLRAYYHHKSADWTANKPYPLAVWTAGELGKLPTYYVMPADRTMPQAVAEEMPTPAEIAACRWLTEPELAVYTAEYQRTGFQGGLNWYRCRLDGDLARELELYAGRTIDVPSAFISGASDWGVHQAPGAYERMQSTILGRLVMSELIPGAGHWVQQEQAARVAELLLSFLARVRG